MAKEPGRNDPCKCGSGKKYKNCCEGKDASSTLSKGAAISLGIALIFGLLIVGFAVMSVGNQPECPPGTSWSTDHQHCH